MSLIQGVKNRYMTLERTIGSEMMPLWEIPWLSSQDPGRELDCQEAHWAET